MECPPGCGCVVTVGQFHAGEADNVIPSEARIAGTIRASGEQQRALLCRRLGEIARGVAQTFRTQATLEQPEGVPVLYNDPALCECVARALTQAIGPQRVSTQTQRISASEDFALIAEKVPSVYLTVGTGEEKDGFLYGNHHPMVRYDENCMPAGAASGFPMRRWTP